LQGKRVGLLICRDVRDKSDELETIYSPGEADLVCFSANWGAGAFPANSWMSFAKSNKTWLAVSNRYGRESNLDFGFGGIGIISPEGKVLCEGLEWGKDCLVVADIP
jgi:predicted amidohydrolase